MADGNNNNGSATGQSGFASKWLNEVNQTNIKLNVSGTKVIDGKSMTLSQAINYFNQMRINDYSGKYQALKQMAGYTGKSDQAAIGYWNQYVRDFFASGEADLNTYAAGRVTAGGGTATAAYPSLTSRETADFTLEQLFRDSIGRLPTAKEKRDYYNELSKAEKSRPTKQITTTSNGRTVQTTIGGITDVEKQQIGLKYVAKYLNAGDPKTVGGTIASGLALIGRYAADYGVNLPDSEVRKNAIAYATGGQTALDTIQSKIRVMSKAMFPGLSNFIDAGLNVADIASSYIAEKANILELNPNTISLKDPDIAQAISGQTTESIADFRARMKNNPLYARTNNALTEVNSLLDYYKNAFKVGRV